MLASRIGTAKAMSGAATAMAAELFIDPRTAMAASANPTKRAPESPRNTLAGLKL